MSYIPSKNLTSVLQKARTGVWIDPLFDGSSVIVCKMAEGVIKAIFKGVECSLLVAVIKVEGFSIMCFGFRVNDEPEHPFTTIIASIGSEDLAHLKNILESRKVTLHCLNELNYPMLSADCLIETTTSQKALNGLESAKPYILSFSGEGLLQNSDILRITEVALDLFQREIYRREYDIPAKFVETTVRISLTLTLRKSVEVLEISPTLSAGPFRIDDVDEGGKQEEYLHALIDRIYPGNAYLSPQVRERSSFRELADNLGFGDQAICIIQSKGISVLTTSILRSSERRRTTVMKHVEKAIKQLQGALRNVRSDTQIYETNGKQITIPGRKTLPAHAIVVLSEMYTFLDWRLIARLVVALSENEQYKALFHVVDISELSYLTNISKDANTFNKYLLQRWMGVKLTGTALGRAKESFSQQLEEN